ncbi:MAG: branched-chain amino acid ABC transporter permease [Carbonactinosporaceae bacterium]
MSTGTKADPGKGTGTGTRTGVVGRLAAGVGGAGGRARWLVAAALAAVVIYLPFYFTPFTVFQLTLVITYAVALLGLNLLVGYAGQISLGHGAFFAVGAYTAAVLLDRFATPHLLTLPVAAAISFALGYAFGVPALRLHGLYLALVTLSLAVITPPLLKRFESVTGGSMGLTVDKPAAPAWTGLADDQWLYFLTLLVAVVAFLGARNLLRSRVGRALLAVRENQVAAQVMGVELARYKTLAFAWSAMYAGVAGALATWAIGFVSPDSFMIVLSISLLASLVVGGLASLSGPVFGAAFYVFVPSVAQDFSKAAPGIVFGLLLIGTMFVAPAGIAGLLRQTGRRLVRLAPSGREPTSHHRPSRRE